MGVLFVFNFCRGGGTCLPTGRLVDAVIKIMYWVYVIKSIQRNYTYVGLTSNLERRLNDHNAGKNKTTKPYRPYNLVHTEEFSTRSDARSREKYLKSGVGREFIKSFL